MNPRLLFVLSGLLLSGLLLPAQRTCGYDAVMADLHAHEPGFTERHAAWQREMTRLIQQAEENRRSTDEPLEVPVVVHVVYNTPQENISVAQIQSQIDILNQDFGRFNADTTNTPSAFQAAAANTRIEFCLANFDPDGNPTNGITRTEATQASWSGNHSVKYTANGGHDGWPRDQYLNIWVCNLSGGLLGYATPPSVADITRDGVVVGYNYFGNVGPLDPSFNLGRTATHEIGHWLGLAHTWGGGGCGSDDNIPDTPMQDGPNFGCPNYPSVSCSNAAQGGDMFMNYMDYSDDICFNLFTQDQKAVMRGLFDPGGVRHPLLSSTACVNPAFHNAATAFSPEMPDTICGTSFPVQSILQNAGENNLNSTDVVIELDGLPVDTLAFNGNLLPTQNVPLAFMPLSVTPGDHTLRCYSLGTVNGFEDPDLTNDTVQFDFFVRDNQGLASPYQADFEGGFLLPEWELINPDSALSWEWTDTAAWSGRYSVVMRGFDYNAIGEVDDFILPQVDISGLAQPKLTFYRAYARFATNSGFNDALEIYASTDCGDTYQLIWSEAGDGLASAPPASFPFIPTSSSQWRGEIVDLSNVAGATGLYLRFRFRNDYENNLYLDAINVLDSANVTVDLATPSAVGFALYPNPSRGQITLQAHAGMGGMATVSLLDPAGRTLRREPWTTQQALRWDLSELPAGLYLIQVQSETGRWTEKVVVRE